MSLSDADGLSRSRREARRIFDRVGSALPTVRARLFALVLVALVPALVILVYDEWLARARAFDALTDLSMRVVRLMERELDDRVVRGAHRLGVLAADPDIVSLSPMSTRKLVDALRDDRLYNNVSIADGATGEVRASAVPLDRAANVSDLLSFQRARRTLDFTTGTFLPEPTTREPGLNLGQPVINETGIVTAVVIASLDLDWVTGFIERSGLPASTVLTVLDDAGVVQYRSVELEKYVGKSAGDYAAALGGASGSATIAVGLDLVERLYVAETVQFRGHPTGSRVTLGIPLAGYRAEMNATLFENVLILAAGTLICFVMAWLVGEALFLREVRPILLTARKVSSGDLTARTGLPEGRGELRELGRTMDDAVAALQAQPSGSGGGARTGGGGESSEGIVPRDDEPRNPHADERHPQHERAGARDRALRPRRISTSASPIRPPATCSASSTTSSTSRRSKRDKLQLEQAPFSLAGGARGSHRDLPAPR